jgi:prepilin-type N-terminal cleavage/methylation domain-containing protein
VKRGWGFTLVEVLVALVVLQVGLLGVAGTLWVAARTMGRADALERGVAVVESLFDSLQASAVTEGEGFAPWEGGRVWWRSGADGLVEIGLSGGGDSTLIEVMGRLSTFDRASP